MLYEKCRYVGMYDENKWVLVMLWNPLYRTCGSKNKFSDFTISLEYKTSEKANSGLFFRTDPKNAVQGGFEIQNINRGCCRTINIAQKFGSSGRRVEQ